MLGSCPQRGSESVEKYNVLLHKVIYAKPVVSKEAPTDRQCSACQTA